MQYKILLIKNRYTGSLNIQKYAIDWFKQYTPVEIVMDTITTDFDVTTQKVSNATFSGVICGADILPKVRTVVPEGKYNAVVFLFGNDLNGIRVSSVNILGDTPLYPDTEFVQTFEGEDGGKTINHELIHCFFFKAHKLQINIVDPMDTYVKDSDLSVDNVIDTNREIALQRLAPYWSQICAFRTPVKKYVNITREKSDSKQTLGYLEARNCDSIFSCRTLERPWLNNKVNISSIPTGTYTVKYTFSWKFMKYTYEVQNVKDRSGIRFHSGNYFFDIEGCILLGNGLLDINKDGEKDVLNSRLTISAFEKFMGKESFTLNIS